MAAHGCNTHTQRAEVQAARSRRDEFATPGPWWPRRNSASAARRGRGPQRWVGPVRSATARGDLKTQPTGGRAEQTSNTARGTLERRRTCGFDTTGGGPGRDRRSASVWRHAEARGSVGPPASRAPSDFFRERLGRITRAQTAPRERGVLSAITYPRHARACPGHPYGESANETLRTQFLGRPHGWPGQARP